VLMGLRAERLDGPRPPGGGGAEWPNTGEAGKMRKPPKMPRNRIDTGTKNRYTLCVLWKQRAAALSSRFDLFSRASLPHRGREIRAVLVAGGKSPFFVFDKIGVSAGAPHVRAVL